MLEVTTSAYIGLYVLNFPSELLGNGLSETDISCCTQHTNLCRWKGMKSSLSMCIEKGINLLPFFVLLQRGFEQLKRQTVHNMAHCNSAFHSAKHWSSSPASTKSGGMNWSCSIQTFTIPPCKARGSQHPSESVPPSPTYSRCLLDYRNFSFLILSNG